MITSRRNRILNPEKVAELLGAEPARVPLLSDVELEVLDSDIKRHRRISTVHDKYVAKVIKRQRWPR